MCTACAVERGQRETRKVVDLLWSVSEACEAASQAALFCISGGRSQCGPGREQAIAADSIVAGVPD